MTRPREEFELTEEELNGLLDAMKPEPLIMLQCGMPKSRQERANDAWAALGAKRGFEPMSVQQHTKGQRWFWAVPAEKAEN
jgi:hypothetical protein